MARYDEISRNIQAKAREFVSYKKRVCERLNHLKSSEYKLQGNTPFLYGGGSCLQLGSRFYKKIILDVCKLQLKKNSIFGI